MTFEEIRQEVQGRGYDYVSADRINQWVNLTYRWVCGLQPWPFLEATASGPAPLEIADLSQILHVGQDRCVLDGVDLRDILDRDPSLSEVGTPTDWYLTGNTVNVWPLSTEEITAHYISTPPAYGQLDEPLVPFAYQEILIDGAVLRGLKDNDEYDTAAALQNVIDISVAAMTDALLQRNYQNQTSIVQTGMPGDYSA